MYRGTTPTITINCDIDVSEFVTMWVTFRTQQLATYAPPKQVEVTKHLGDEGVDATDKVVTVSLTQADTLRSACLDAVAAAGLTAVNECFHAFPARADQ